MPHVRGDEVPIRAPPVRSGDWDGYVFFLSLENMLWTTKEFAQV